MKLNCWEVKKCGQQPGGHNAYKSGVCCPAAVDTEFHGINDGIDGGRTCWLIEGTLCAEHFHGLFQKIFFCRECAFYQEVRKEEDQFPWEI